MVAVYGNYQNDDGSWYRGWPRGREPSFTAKPVLAIFAVAAALLLGCPPPVASPPVVPFCSLPWSNCLDVGCGDSVEQWWCCEEGGECSPVDHAINCPPGTAWIAYCEHGQSTPASGPDGEGWECLE